MGDEGSEEDEGGSEGGQDVGQQWELQVKGVGGG